MENSRVMVCIGAFLFGFSIVLIIVAMFFTKELEAGITADYPETILGWIGATVIGGIIAMKNYMNSSGGGYGMGGQEEGDSIVSFVVGLSLALYALLGTWLYIINVGTYALAICLLSSACAFLGLIAVSYFSSQAN